MPADRRAQRTALLAWYDTHGRPLPWRADPDAYGIWIAEIMAQQTRIDTVVPRHRAFVTEFPDVWALAAAPVTRVCEAWAGLGYYRRARNLHAAAVRIVTEHGGELPQDVETLRQLPGIGRYTAGAIASTAFAVEAPVVDGNVARVLSRVHALDEVTTRASAQNKLWDWAAALVQGQRPGDLNQALMEVGALVCLPRAPRCGVCPLAAWCAARAGACQTSFPRRSAAAPRSRLTIAFAWLPTPRGLWLEQRPVDGLWAGLWEPPSASGPRAKALLRQRIGVELGRPLATVSHQLSHRDITARIYGAPRSPRWRASSCRKRFKQPLDAPLSALARKALRAQLRVDTTR